MIPYSVLIVGAIAIFRQLAIRGFGWVFRGEDDVGVNAIFRQVSWATA